ncbi:MAG: HDOD domain-containing protein [Phycisphaerales bacterium]|jgi:diguanylate cyclase (GGDEF)-like protein
MRTPLERVLTCPNLPTLPGVAMQVLELTRDPRVSIQKIADLVQNDPALTTKVLRTVNSSYYGLATPCPSISRAMSLLGLNTVKSIVLGFSLVETTKAVGLDDQFDLESYWRRSVYGAAASRAIALGMRGLDPEEAFVGSLLQDIGMLAAFAGLKHEYTDALADGPRDHDLILEHEQQRLGFDHAKVGKMLAEKWRLPPQIQECIAHHHKAERAAAHHKILVQVVALGGMAASALQPRETPKKAGQFIVTARQWFQFESAKARELLEQTAKGAADLTKTLDLKTGERPDLATILGEAHEQMAEAQEEMQRETVELKQKNDELAKKTITDGLTGAYNRAHFDVTLRAQAAKCKAANHPISVVFLDADKFKHVNDTHGHQAGDAVLMELTKRLRGVADRVGTLCRYGGEEFVLVLPQVGLDRAARVGEILRQTIAKEPFDLGTYEIPGLKLAVTISVGVATCEPASATADWTPEQLTQAADECVYAAKQAGRNCVRQYGMATTNTAGAMWNVFVIDDDKFVSRLLQKNFSSKSEYRCTFFESAEEALAAITSTNASQRPHLVLTDLNLPGMSGIELTKALRQRKECLSMRIVIMSGDSDAGKTDEMNGAGADMFMDKMELSSNFASTAQSLASLLGRSRAA